MDEAEQIADCLRRDFAICPDKECAADGGGTFLGTFCDRCGRDVFIRPEAWTDEHGKEIAGRPESKVWGGQLLGWTTQREIDALDKSIETDW